MPACIARNCVTTSPPGPNQARPLSRDEGQALIATATTTRAIRTSPPAEIAPSDRSTRLSAIAPAPARPPASLSAPGSLTRQWIAIHCELTIERTVLLPGLVTHARNLKASPFGAPFVTIQKL